MAKERRGIHLIAELAHVSIGTVDRALHGRAGINDDTRQRILQIARQVGYAPNLAARALSVAKANTKIGVCVPREIHFFTISCGAASWKKHGGRHILESSL